MPDDDEQVASAVGPLFLSQALDEVPGHVQIAAAVQAQIHYDIAKRTLPREGQEGTAECREARPLLGVVGVIELKVKETGLGKELEPVRLLGMPEVQPAGPMSHRRTVRPEAAA